MGNFHNLYIIKAEYKEEKKIQSNYSSDKQPQGHNGVLAIHDPIGTFTI